MSDCWEGCMGCRDCDPGPLGSEYRKLEERVRRIERHLWPCTCDDSTGDIEADPDCPMHVLMRRA